MHTAEFTGPVAIGEVVTGVSRGTTKRRPYETAWCGTYQGVQTSEWTGEPVHTFTDGIIGQTPQACFQMPVVQFNTSLEIVGHSGIDGEERVIVTGKTLASQDPVDLTRYLSTGNDCGAVLYATEVGGWTMLRDTISGTVLFRYYGGEEMTIDEPR